MKNATITLGIDLAAQPANTGLCRVAWREGGARVEVALMGADDATIIREARVAAANGFDCPFGWPAAFHACLAAHAAGDGLPFDEWRTETRDRLRFRATDYHVRAVTGRWPLSVSTDMIGVPALRMVKLLDTLGVRDRSGAGGVYEVYPAALLARWGLPQQGYKRPAAGSVRRQILTGLRALAPWLEMTEAQEMLMLKKADVLDALLAALGARAAVLGLTEGPPPEHASTARLEGWIHVPTEAALAQLPRS